MSANLSPVVSPYLTLKLAQQLYQKSPDGLEPDERKRVDNVAAKQCQLESLILATPEAAQVALPESSIKASLKEIRQRMSLAGAQVRSREVLEVEASRANGLVTDVMQRGCRYSGAHDLKQAFRTRHLCFAHTAYLQAIDFALRSGVGSRGSAIVLDRSGAPIHDLLDATWRILPEDSGFRAKILETELKPDGSVCSAWTDSRPVPETGSWFETTWADYREGKIYTSQ